VEIYDIVMLIVLASACLFGAYKGFAWQLASIASIVFCYFVAFRFREPLSKSIVAEPPWDQFLAMLILFVGTSLVVWVGFNMVRRTIDRMKLKEFDRQIGALFGLLKGGLYCALITLFAVTLAGDSIREKIVASKSGRFIARNLDRSESVIPPEIHQFLRPYLDRLEDEFQGSRSGPAGDLAGQVFDGARASFSDSGEPYVPPAFGVEPQTGFQTEFQPLQSLPGNAPSPSGNTSVLPATWRQ
jgi:membrane protein required for colicin V production